jgi:hypothetical protein
MSYIRELRPYMYWLGHLADGRAAGELDWQAIGGTWGCATSRVATWTDAGAAPLELPGLAALLERIERQGPVLSRYVHKYFVDLAAHVRAMTQALAPGATVHYIVGNSRFYDVLVPTETLLAALLDAAGLAGVSVRTLRKRTSKKELFEYVVTARRA